jgi:hypothetical protein
MPHHSIVTAAPDELIKEVTLIHDPLQLIFSAGFFPPKPWSAAIKRVIFKNTTLIMLETSQIA